MGEKEPEQQTPQGHAIPVPKRKDVLRDLRIVAKATKPPRPEGVDRGSAPKK
jgi:hypothetical protein